MMKLGAKIGIVIALPIFVVAGFLMKDFISEEWRDYNYEKNIDNIYKNYLYYGPRFLGSYWDEDTEERKEYFDSIVEDYYRDRNDKIIFYRSYKGRQLITGADYNTFTPLGMLYSRDKNYFYYEGEKLSYDVNKNPRWVGEFIVDDQNVYHNFSQMILTGVNPQEFKNIEGPNGGSIYYADKNYIYLDDGKILEKADVNSFQIINGNYAKDNGNVYWGPFVLTGADVASFEIIDINTAKDKNHTYKNGVIVE